MLIWDPSNLFLKSIINTAQNSRSSNRSNENLLCSNIPILWDCFESQICVSVYLHIRCANLHRAPLLCIHTHMEPCSEVHFKKSGKSHMTTAHDSGKSKQVSPLNQTHTSCFSACIAHTPWFMTQGISKEIFWEIYKAYLWENKHHLTSILTCRSPSKLESWKNYLCWSGIGHSKIKVLLSFTPLFQKKIILKKIWEPKDNGPHWLSLKKKKKKKKQTHFSKYHLVCSTEERKSYRFGRQPVSNFNFGWTIPLPDNSLHSGCVTCLTHDC